MTTPFVPDYNPVTFDDVSFEEEDAPENPGSPPLPSPIVSISAERRLALTNWLDERLMSLVNAHQSKLSEWTLQEIAYRAQPEPPKSTPFVGACNLVVPLIAMGVDPIVARLDVSILKADPIVKFKPLRRSMVEYTNALEDFYNFYVVHRLHLRDVVLPRMLEQAKHGTCVFKTIFDYECSKVKTYDKDWRVVEREVVRFKGPRVFGVSLADFLFPSGYQNIQACPLVAERIRLTPEALWALAYTGKVDPKAVEKIVEFKMTNRTILDDARAMSANHQESTLPLGEIELFDIWADFDLGGDKQVEKINVFYHRDTQTILRLNFNPFFNQRKPYTVIPYMIASDSIYGIGIAEMTEVFQRWLTHLEQDATNNSYLANAKMWGVRKGSAIAEKGFAIFPGNRIPLDDPASDVKPFDMGSPYSSTFQQRQGFIGYNEKRTGISDYLTGRESPIVGSRATATSTMALISEGKARVEEVLENWRIGLQEIISNCMDLHIQFGTEDLEALIFDPETADLITKFFDNATELNVDGALAITLGVSDAASNRVAQQQTQLAVIQMMMTYLQKVVELGTAAVNGSVPKELAESVMSAARTMFKELLNTYDVPNADQYLPDLEAFLASIPGPGGAGGPSEGVQSPAPNGPPGTPDASGILSLLAQGQGAAGGSTASPPS